MKKNSTKLLVMAFAIFGLSACGGENTGDKEARKDDTPEKLYDKHQDHEDMGQQVNLEMQKPGEIPTFSNIAPGAQNHADEVIKDYLAVKNALVQSNTQEASNAASNLLNKIKNFDKSALPQEQMNYYSNISKQLNDAAEYISRAQEIEKQRDHFATLTKHIYELTKAFDANQQTLYYQFCPMAFNNKGGYWISAKQEIENPYFGDKMLNCGRIAETIQ